MIDDSQIHEPATPKQRKLIDKISKEFPEVKSMLEYEDYTAKPTVGNASELISRALEDAADRGLHSDPTESTAIWRSRTIHRRRYACES